MVTIGYYHKVGINAVFIFFVDLSAVRIQKYFPKILNLYCFKDISKIHDNFGITETNTKYEVLKI